MIKYCEHFSQENQNRTVNHKAEIHITLENVIKWANVVQIELLMNT